MPTTAQRQNHTLHELERTISKKRTTEELGRTSTNRHCNRKTSPKGYRKLCVHWQKSTSMSRLPPSWQQQKKNQPPLTSLFSPLFKDQERETKNGPFYCIHNVYYTPSNVPTRPHLCPGRTACEDNRKWIRKKNTGHNVQCERTEATEVSAFVMSRDLFFALLCCVCGRTFP